MTEISGERLRVLANFIRGQAYLTNENPPKPGPGDVRLNHEQALLCADALDAEIRYREGQELSRASMKELMAWAQEEWLDASEDVAMGGGTGRYAAKMLADSPHLQRMCQIVDHWSAMCALLREAIEHPGIVTVQVNEAGECVAVTRTDEDHIILSVLWEHGAKPDER